jgi:hypothetical protein
MYLYGVYTHVGEWVAWVGVGGSGLATKGMQITGTQVLPVPLLLRDRSLFILQTIVQ